MVRALRDHRLEMVVDIAKVRLAEMRRVGTSVYSVQICETPTGLTITGDLRITDTGVVHAIGKSLAWFAGELSENYIAEKFLERRWNADLAREDLRVVAQIDDPDVLVLSSINEALSFDDDEAVAVQVRHRSTSSRQRQ
jgi:hypothetical protein